jgi:hypothetical protein
MLTMKPERSLVRIGCLPSRRAKASARSTIVWSVSSPTTTSTSFMTGTGEKKCRPSTLPRRLVQEASWAIGMEDVLEARMASSESSPSSVWNRGPLIAGSSKTASTTAPQPARASRSVVHSIRPSSGPMSDSSSLPRSTARLTELSTLPRERSSAAG